MAQEHNNLVPGALINEMEQKLENEIYKFKQNEEKNNKEINNFETKINEAKNSLAQLDKHYQEQESKIAETKESCDDLEMKLAELENFIRQRPNQPNQNQWMLHSFKSEEEKQVFLQKYAEEVLKQIHQTTETLHLKFKEQQNVGKLQA